MSTKLFVGDRQSHITNRPRDANCRSLCFGNRQHQSNVRACGARCLERCGATCTKSPRDPKKYSFVGNTHKHTQTNTESDESASKIWDEIFNGFCLACVFLKFNLGDNFQMFRAWTLKRLERFSTKHSNVLARIWTETNMVILLLI